MNTNELEVKCDKCDGQGGWHFDGGWGKCHVCHGAGHIPTEFGQKVLALMRHNFRPLYEWMMENNPPASAILFPLISAINSQRFRLSQVAETVWVWWASTR
jgi:hypothetical protein